MIGIALRIAYRPVDGVEPVGHHIQWLYHLAHLLDFRGETIVLFFRRFAFARQDYPRVALPPAAIIERDNKVTSLREGDSFRPQRHLVSAPTVSHHDGWQLLTRVGLADDRVSGHTCALAVDVDRAKHYVIRNHKRLQRTRSRGGRRAALTQNSTGKNGNSDRSNEQS